MTGGRALSETPPFFSICGLSVLLQESFPQTLDLLIGDAEIVAARSIWNRLFLLIELSLR